MNSQSYQNIWSCVLRYVLFAHDLINFLLKKKKAKGGRQRVCTQCVIKVKFFYLMHECYKRPNMIYQFMSQNEVWCASWNVWYPWIFFFCFVKTARFPWNLVHKKRKVFTIYFSKICAWNMIRTPLLPLIPSINLFRQEIMLFLCSLCYNVWETFWNMKFFI